MKTKISHHFKSLLLPCAAFSLAVGFIAALYITAFKILAEWIIHLSSSLYAMARANPILLPIIVLGAAIIGLIASFILSVSHSSRGGGIPSSVAAIRGIVSLKWLASIFVLPISALLSYLAGIPLGTEGPCVQIGTAIGDGVGECFGKGKNKGWHRYVMTGGASAGFSIATASPITAILFSTEELHKHFSPLLLTVASLSVATADLTTRILASFGIGSLGLFTVPNMEALSLKLFFAPLIVGLAAGLASVLFTKLFHIVDAFMKATLKKLSIKIVFPALFALISLVGFFFKEALGTGHSLAAMLLTGRFAWYLLILAFLMRAVFMMLSNTAGTTGGLFLPTIAFGAIVGSLCADGMIALGLIGGEYYTLMVVLGITAFLGSTSRIPITACVFAIEALGSIYNIPSLVIAVTIAVLVVEISGVEDFTDTVIESKMKAISNGKSPAVIETSLTVKEGSFASGKEMRDILWPNACFLVSFNHAIEHSNSSKISAGDVITVRYETYNEKETAEELEALVGKQ